MLYKKNRLFRDTCIACLLTFSVFYIFIFFDLVDRWFNFTRLYEIHELDEAIGLIPGFFIGLLFFTYRLLIYVRKDNTRIYKLAESLEYEVSYDHLTGLPNRRAFEKKVRDLISESEKSESYFTLFYIDIDSFKYINDTLGHTVGDKVLIAITKRLANIGITNSILARIGGDEFCMAIRGYLNDQQCLDLCTQLNKAVMVPFTIDTHKLYISQTVGISRYPEDGTSYEALLQTAHIAMSMGKNSGHRRNNFKDGNFTQVMKMRFIIQHGLKDALDNHQLYVEYQPKVSLASNTLVGSEALVRWRHPEHGLIAPDQFIYIAEEVKAVHLIDFFVLEEVCKQISLWGEDAKPVAVNLSPILFADENLFHKIMFLLIKYKVSPHLLELEITERTLVTDSEIPLMLCQKLVEQGFVISLDDFGTGYSSLAHIANFPISTLKVDRAFINQICANERTLDIVTAIISLAKALNVKVIAEGLETEEQRIILKELGCHEAQGYLFDKPLSKDVFSERLLDSIKAS
ncbi:putative bifunctional diguanylate cyclase/phosphodiesterase [Psychromonas algicola]|uniref:putative bifunctional diguanylate cyclase/phosphodiesterase n=1 Tax=Psychromonas algicola TaxID=2555642 RepID=UPI0010678DE1|nr:GGDEF domain-containing phosphodiesterase [Psychromonas sp. RZ5]TEW47275.1 phosphodiesterase [Psychromonas sp. RZ5]